MALAIDASTPSLATSTTAAVTTASFTPPSGALLVLCYGANNGTAAQDTSISTVTNTGTAATWTRRARKNNNASSTGGTGTDGGAEIWTATAPGAAITVTANGLNSGAGYEKALKIWVLTGADTTNVTNVAGATAASALPSVALAGCLAGSHVFAVSSDWNQAGLGTAGTGQTISTGDEMNVTGQITTHTWRTTSVLASSGSQTMNLTAPAAEKYNLVVLEVRDGGGAAATAPLHHLSNLRVPIIRAANF